MRKILFTWPPHKNEEDKAFGSNLGFIMLSIFGLLFTTYGISNYFYTDLCWNFGRAQSVRISDKKEYHGRNTSYRITVEANPPNAQNLGEIDVSPEFFAAAKVNSGITVRYFAIFPSKIIADSEQRWSDFFAGILGIAALIFAMKARREYISLTNQEPIPLRSLSIYTTQFKQYLKRRKQD